MQIAQVHHQPAARRIGIASVKIKNFAIASNIIEGHFDHRWTLGEDVAYLKEGILRRELSAIKVSLASLERSI